MTRADILGDFNRIKAPENYEIALGCLWELVDVLLEAQDQIPWDGTQSSFFRCRAQSTSSYSSSNALHTISLTTRSRKADTTDGGVAPRPPRGLLPGQVCSLTFYPAVSL